MTYIFSSLIIDRSNLFIFHKVRLHDKVSDKIQIKSTVILRSEFQTVSIALTHSVFPLFSGLLRCVVVAK